MEFLDQIEAARRGTLPPEERLSFLERLISEIEWTNLGEGDVMCCPWCFQTRETGHRGGVVWDGPDGAFTSACPVGAALGRESL